jgi:hypothetical protein
MRPLTAFVFAFVMAASLAPRAAAADVANPTLMVEEVTLDFLAGLIREIGGGDVQIHSGEGGKSISFMDGDVPYNVTLALCETERPDKCYGFGLLVLMADTGFSNEALNKWNKDTMLLTLFKDDEKNIGIGRIELTDGGVTKKHVGAAISWFVNDVRELLKSINSQVTVQGPQGAAKQVALAPTLRPLAATREQVARAMKRLTKPYEVRRDLRR